MKARVLKRSLGTKFGLAPITIGKDSDHEWLGVTVPGARPVAVMFSLNDADLGDVLVGLICKQLRVRRPYLNGMVQCSNSRQAYYQKLVDEEGQAD